MKYKCKHCGEIYPYEPVYCNECGVIFTIQNFEVVDVEPTWVKINIL